MDRCVMKRLLVAVAALAAIAVTAPAHADDRKWHAAHHEPGPHHGAPAPSGDPSEWAWVNGDEAATSRWDPCTVITWSSADYGPAFEADFARAVKVVARFSGYRFQRVEDGGMIDARTATAAEVTAVVPSGAVAYASTNGLTRGGTEFWASSGHLTFWDEMLKPKWRDSLSRLFLHELGHVMGLGHVESSVEVMYKGGPADDRMGLGDRAGLAAVNPQVCAPAIPAARGEFHRTHTVTS